MLTTSTPRRGQVLTFSPTRLAAVDTVYAMTVHKSQGSQFDTAAALLPAATSRVLTRELLHTAVTRARKHLIVAQDRGEAPRRGVPPGRAGLRTPHPPERARDRGQARRHLGSRRPAVVGGRGR
jgi:UvrD-like helicase family protein